MFQFYHDRPFGKSCISARGGTTSALFVPDRSDIERLLEFEAPRIMMDFGQAKCHPNENYNRKTGTGIAELRSQPKSFILIVVEIDNDTRYYTLRTDDGVIVILKGNLNSDRLNFQRVL